MFLCMFGQGECYWVHPSQGQCLSNATAAGAAASQAKRRGSMPRRGDSAMALSDAQFQIAGVRQGPGEPQGSARAELPSEETRPTAGPRPIVFLHGVGFGLVGSPLAHQPFAS